MSNRKNKYQSPQGPPPGGPPGRSGGRPPPGRPGASGKPPGKPPGRPPVGAPPGYGGYGTNTFSIFQQQGVGSNVKIQPGHNIRNINESNQLFDSKIKNYDYKYSNCQGKRKALLIGINYIGTKNKLNGCINDVKNVEQFLIENGYQEDDIVKLVDTANFERAIPTRTNIIDAMEWLVKDAKENDSLFFHFSGHGGLTEDKNNIEYDGFAQVIYPLDFETNGSIIDYDLHTLLVKPLPKGCRLTTIFDCCHSGSILNLPYMYSTKGVIKQPNILAEVQDGLIDTVTSSLLSGTFQATKLLTLVGTAAFKKFNNDKIFEQQKKTNTSPADVISLSGCKDNQTSADSKIGGMATGAMSYAFMKVMNSGQAQSYISLLNNIREILDGQYSQKPQLSASHPIDVNIKFIF
ncbi:caspase family protein ASCRUDRAFT_33987 [Ascoidea rubescens DSM 1968]|uniref:Metacaspase-1 n=1 Tax=Ascoidea rubescens DSM 1968 TaxID=1344418 RepID=A0A1D2VIF4_9ASCO|nr:hypothetical protein ASCRUDRAFT_33987 [Ascoidea rubescens DSM 1968]ODV61399.1 hypothetical protein ASCRUDRAFT_33987 [Ascoidea rubescens DSM 1968]